MHTESVRRTSASLRRITDILLGNVWVLGLGLALASSPATAELKAKHKTGHRETEHISRQPFGEMPKGPLQVIISINQQKLHFYSDGKHVADALVATGVPGHLTPLGVFSVIERDRYHHSNLYSNAPMPFMERITWSGVALHEGPGVGRQASHGCIRMPHDFAARLWQLQTMGMRVIITHPEVQPVDFADSHLFVHKEKALAPTAALPKPIETAQSVTPGTKTDAVNVPLAVAAIAAPANGAAEVTPAPIAEPVKSEAAAPATQAPAAAAPMQSAAPAMTMPPAPSKVAAPTLAEMLKSAETQATEPTEVESKAAEPNKTSDPASDHQENPAKVTTIDKSGAGTEPDETAEPVPAQPANTGAITTTAAGSAAAPAKPAQPSSTEPKVAVSPPAETGKTAAPVRAAPAVAVKADITAPIALDDVPLPLVKPERIAKSGGGPIAIFVSRKQGKIFVRQNFTPVFQAPVKIEHPERPLGTHVFTALDYTPDHSAFRWNVVSLPGESVKTTERWKYVRDAYGRRYRVRVEERSTTQTPPPESPQEALARIDIPPDVIDQISQLMVPGSSLVVSDQGLGPETGSGTDFIVVTR